MLLRPEYGFLEVSISSGGKFRGGEKSVRAAWTVSWVSSQRFVNMNMSPAGD